MAAPVVEDNNDDADNYYGGYGCFGETSTVIVQAPDGSRKQTAVVDIRKGDKVLVAGGALAEVRCLVRIARDARKNLLSLPGGLTITKRHPIRINDQWMLP